MHQHDRAGADPAGNASVHRLSRIAAPVVGVEIPAHELEAEIGCDRPATRGGDAPRRSPMPRSHAEAFEQAQPRLGVAAERGLVDLGVADVPDAVESDLVSLGAHAIDQRRMRCRPRRP